MKRAVLALPLLLAASPAHAGAWTQSEDHWQLISGGSISAASSSFGAPADCGGLHFGKTLAQADTEYGWRDSVTLFVNSEVASARSCYTNGKSATSTAIEAGGRVRLFDDWGVGSLSASYKSAGAFNFSDSSFSRGHFVSGQVIELRALYGTNFALLEMPGFADIELAQRFVSAPRPDETPLDFTAGLTFAPGWMAILQSFNLVSGPGNALYGSYSSHKLELSLVATLTPMFRLQAGGFVSPAGHNSLKEQGLVLALWSSF